MNEVEEQLYQLNRRRLTQMQEVQDLVKEAVTEALTEALTEATAAITAQAAAEKAQLTQKIADEKVQTILHLYLGGVPVELIAVSVGKSMDEIQHIAQQHSLLS